MTLVFFSMLSEKPCASWTCASWTTGPRWSLSDINRATFHFSALRIPPLQSFNQTGSIPSSVIPPAIEMGNVTSSLNGGGLNSLASVIDEVRSNPNSILDLLSIYNAKLALFVSHTTSEMRLNPSDVLSSLLASGRDIATSLSGMVKEAGSRPHPAEIPSFTRKQWQRVIALIPVSRKSPCNARFLFMIKYLQKTNLSH